MRFVSAGLVVGSLLFASVAYAGEGKEAAAGHGKGGSAVGAAVENTGGDNGGLSGEEALVTKKGVMSEGEAENEDKADPFEKTPKRWEVGLSFETHRIITENDLAGGDASNGPPDSGYGADKMLNAYSAFVRYDITKRDHLRLAGFMTEAFLVDSGESGVRLDDTNIGYTHEFSLPWKLGLDGIFSFTLPTGFGSYKAATITSLHLGAGLSRRFGPVSVEARAIAAYDVQSEESYSGSAGGAPTALGSIALTGDAEVKMPFFDPLSAGIGLTTGYSLLNDIAVQNPSVAYPYRNQQVQQSYGGEVYVRYMIPMLAGFKSDISVAYAMGDGTLGYTSFLHDGVGHFYVGYREVSEFYANFSVRY